MAPNKKKKKVAAANPARGFATTSVQSKAKAETTDDVKTDDVKPLRNEDKSSGQSSRGKLVKQLDAVSEVKELHELSPEELEAQLELSDLQQFIEQYGPKIRKESARHASRQLTDKRLLRVQAEPLLIRRWVPDAMAEQVLNLCRLTPEDDGTSKKESAVGDELVTKVWQLQSCLLELGFSLSRIQESLHALVARSRVEDSTSPLWGLNDTLQWLSIHCSPEELGEYDQTATHSIQGLEDEDDEPTVIVNDAGSDMPSSKEDDSAHQAEDPVSDVGSDLDPNEMLDVYLQTKERLFNIDPNADMLPARGAGKKSDSQNRAPATPTQRKLQQRLRKLRSDLLFDEQDANLKWASRRIELVREQSERKRFRLDENQSEVSSSTATASNVMEEADKLAELVLDDDADEDVLGGMFDALPGVLDAPQTDQDAVPAGSTVLRDFGKITGLHPRRIFEETCRARDSGARVTYRQISPTTYSCRHSVTVKWSKPSDISHHTDLDSVSVSRKTSSTVVSMVAIATSDTIQSEAFVSTAALFVLFSGSPKEAKASLRLPSAYRDLWDEFVKEKQDKSDAADRDTVKALRDLVEQSLPVLHDGTDEIIYAPVTRRANGTSGTSTPTVEAPSTPASSPQLQELWHRKTLTPAYQEMLRARQQLPMFGYRSEALDIINRHQVTILCGETGCGKSTQLPAFLLEHELSSGRDCKIYCTEPRRISAISLAQRVSEEMGERKGDVGTNRSLVGYAIRLESHTASSTKLVYATVGIVLRMLEGRDALKEVTHLVVDEVHERSIDTDFLLVILRSLMVKRPDLKVVLMSATVDAQKFSAYFDGAPVLNVPGRTFPVQARFLEDAIELTGHTVDGTVSHDQDDEREDLTTDKTAIGDLSAYSKRTRTTLAEYDEYRIDYHLIVKLLEIVATAPDYAPFSKAILIFLPGIAEIRQLNDMLGGHPVFSRSWRIFPLHSAFSSEDQQAAFALPPPGVRKIVIATNIAETGITIPDVTCVIDTGKHKEMRFDERRQMSRLIQSFIARANAKQRRGRAGRVQEGICFHLFTKFRHDNLMVDQQTPEMLRLSLQDLVMRVKICKLGDIETALSQALDPPASKNIRRAIDALVEVGALTTAEELTPLGQQLAKLPLDAQLGKLLLLGSIYGCLDVTLTIAATLSSKTPFLTPMHAKSQADSVRIGFKRGDSDLLTVYNAYSSWRKICTTNGMSEFQFCSKNFLSPQNLANIEDLKAQLLQSMLDAGFVNLSSEQLHALSKLRHQSRHRHFVELPHNACRHDDNDDLLDSVITWSFYPKVLRREGKGWRNIANNQSLALHQTSVNKNGLSSDIKSLSFYSIMQTSRFTNAQETSAVSDFALVLLAGEAVFHLYAGVIIIDGNRLKFKVNDWKTMVVLKLLRLKMKECQAKMLRHPGRPLGAQLQKWADIFETIFTRRQVPAVNGSS